MKSSFRHPQAVDVRDSSAEERAHLVIGATQKSDRAVLSSSLMDAIQ